MRGRPAYDCWSFHKTGDHYTAERIVDGKNEVYDIGNCHCLACAKTKVLATRGGRVDLRGSHLAGMCGSFLQATAAALEDEKNHDCMENAVPYESDGALGHGFECGICGKFLQAG